MDTTISVQIPDELAEELSDLANESGRPRSYHIQKAIEKYIYDQADLQIAIARLHDISDPVISLEDLIQMKGIDNENV